MNIYLEKIASLTKEALNAYKARALAKKVGVIPDTDSAWKYALRNLRDSKGEPLTGLSLANARVRLGDISNNAYQKLRSYATKGVAPGTEISAVIDRSSGNLLGTAAGKTGAHTAPYLKNSNLHSHPYESNSNYSYIKGQQTYRGPGRIDTTYRAGYPHRIAAPSGYGYTIDSTRLLRDRFGGDIQKATSFRNQILSKGKAPDDRLTKSLEWNPGGDISVFSNNTFEGYSPLGHRETILAPHTNTVSSTRMKILSNKKIVVNGKRANPVTIYFDHSPRKTKEL